MGHLPNFMNKRLLAKNWFGQYSAHVLQDG